MLPGWYVQPGLLPDEHLAPSQSRITLRAEKKALRVTVNLASARKTRRAFSSVLALRGTRKGCFPIFSRTSPLRGDRVHRSHKALVNRETSAAHLVFKRPPSRGALFGLFPSRVPSKSAGSSNSKHSRLKSGSSRHLLFADTGRVWRRAACHAALRCPGFGRQQVKFKYMSHRKLDRFERRVLSTPTHTQSVSATSSLLAS